MYVYCKQESYNIYQREYNRLWWLRVAALDCPDGYTRDTSYHKSRAVLGNETPGRRDRDNGLSSIGVGVLARGGDSGVRGGGGVETEG